jgi:hypothetical protein
MDTAELTPQITPAESAVIAAHQAVDAAGALLLFSREGQQAYSAFGDAETVEKLAEALLLATRIHLDHFDDGGHMTEYRDEVGQIAAACERFIEGWAG